MGGIPDRSAAIEQYRAAAPGYDPHMRRFARWHRMAVDRLALRPGETAIDVACGTGLVFPLLRDAVGPEGRVVGIDLSPDMVRQAEERIQAAGWENVAVIESAVEEAPLDLVADAALFAFTHDVLQTRAAVATSSTTSVRERASPPPARSSPAASPRWSTTSSAAPPART